MSRHETTDRLSDILIAYELNEAGAVVTRHQPGVLIQRAGTHATLRDRGDGTFSVLLADGTDLLLARMIWALVHGRWPAGPLLAIDGDDTNVAIANLVEADTLSVEDRDAIIARQAARWAEIEAAEQAAQQARKDMVARREQARREADARRAESGAQTEAVAAMWMADDLADLEALDEAKLAARQARAAARADAGYPEPHEPDAMPLSHAALGNDELSPLDDASAHVDDGQAGLAKSMLEGGGSQDEPGFEGGGGVNTRPHPTEIFEGVSTLVPTQKAETGPDATPPGENFADLQTAPAEKVAARSARFA
jgi:hypothetical protein